MKYPTNLLTNLRKYTDVITEDNFRIIGGDLAVVLEFDTKDETHNFIISTRDHDGNGYTAYVTVHSDTDIDFCAKFPTLFDLADFLTLWYTRTPDKLPTQKTKGAGVIK